MSWVRPTLDQIYARITADLRSRVTDDTPIPPGSLLGRLTEAVVGAAHLQYGFLEWLKRQEDIENADEFGLTLWGKRYNLPRKAPVEASGFVAFTGTVAYSVPQGTAVVNNAGYEFTTQGAFVIGTDDEVEVVASEEGADSNCEDTDLTLGSPSAFIDDVAPIVEDPDAPGVMGFDNGVDLETLEAWRYRLSQRSKNPPSSGTVADYERWALEVPGVGRAWCIPAELWLGAGTVGLYVATVDLDAVSAGVLAAVETYVDAVRPIPANVTYATITQSDIHLWTDIKPNRSDLQTAIDAALVEMIGVEASPGGKVLLSHIRKAIMIPGLEDYAIDHIHVDSIPVPLADLEVDFPVLLKYWGTTYGTLA